MSKTFLLLNRVKTAVMYLICCVVFAPGTYAQDIRFEAHVDRTTISLAENFQLNLTVSGEQNAPDFRLPDIEGFIVRGTTSSSNVQYKNGKVSTSVTRIYLLEPLRTGTFTLGPYSLTIANKTFNTEPVTVNVIDAAASSQKQPSSVPQSSQGGSFDDRIFAVLEPLKTIVYVNEKVPVRVKLYINKLSIRGLEFPVVSHDVFSLLPFDTKPLQYPEILAGVSYNVVDFQSHLYAVKQGTYSLGPAEISCNVLIRKQHKRNKRRSLFDDFLNDSFFDSFFGGYEERWVTVQSPSVEMQVLPFPEEGKPKDFSGAVKEIPAIVFDYFDPELQEFRKIENDPIAITVTKSDSDETLQIIDAPVLHQASPVTEELGRDIVFIKAEPGRIKQQEFYFFHKRGFIFWYIVPFFVALSIIVMRHLGFICFK